MADRRPLNPHVVVPKPEAELSHEIVIIMEESERNVQMRENQENKKSRQIGVSLDIGNFCTLSALFNQY